MRRQTRLFRTARCQLMPISSMTRLGQVCDDSAVRIRPALTIALCLVLAAVRVVGTHVHLEHTDSPGSSHAITHHFTMTEDDSPGHLMSHLLHGDVDADDSVQSTAKLFLTADVFGPALLFIVLCSLFEPAMGLLLPRSRPPLRPPPRRSVFALSPPSHAPPVAS